MQVHHQIHWAGVSRGTVSCSETSGLRREMMKWKCMVQLFCLAGGDWCSLWTTKPSGKGDDRELLAGSNLLPSFASWSYSGGVHLLRTRPPGSGYTTPLLLGHQQYWESQGKEVVEIWKSVLSIFCTSHSPQKPLTYWPISWFSPSTCPLDCGWWPKVILTLTPNFSMKACQTWEVNGFTLVWHYVFQQAKTSEEIVEQGICSLEICGDTRHRKKNP